MHTDNGQTRSSWMNIDTPQSQPISQDVETDVAIVGAGIAGLTTAYLLLQSGKRVAIFDDGPVAGGDSSRTSAHLASEIDDGLAEIERIFSTGAAKLAHESHAAAIDTIERIAREELIECDFERVDGYLWEAEGSTQNLTEEFEAALRAGWADVAKAERAPIDFDTGPCLRFPRQAQFNPLKYLAGLARCIERDGGQFFHAHAKNIEGGDAPQLEANGKTVRASAIVVATNSPINDRVKLHTKQGAYRTYMIGMKIEKGAVSHALYWDTLDPYHYARVQSEGDEEILIVGGEDHKTGQENDGDARFESLEKWTRERFPVGETTHRWSGHILETVDGLAFIGHNNGDDDPIYVATGDSGMGLTHGTIAGILLSDLICGRANPWKQIYDPNRKAVKAARDFIEENANVMAQYIDLVTPGEVGSANEIARGEGAVVRRGLSKIAVFCDDAGKFHECSAICPHLGAVVSWNSTEKTWDCPAHGSRFRTDGAPVNGPSNAPLAPIE